MPNEQNLKPFQPGQSGNPNGYSKGRRFTDRLIKLIEEKSLDEKIVTAWLGAATGDEELLEGRKPNAAFFSMLIERVEGKIPDPEPESAGVLDELDESDRISDDLDQEEDPPIPEEIDE